MHTRHESTHVRSHRYTLIHAPHTLLPPLLPLLHSGPISTGLDHSSPCSNPPGASCCSEDNIQRPPGPWPYGPLAAPQPPTLQTAPSQPLSGLRRPLPAPEPPRPAPPPRPLSAMTGFRVRVRFPHWEERSLSTLLSEGDWHLDGCPSLHRCWVNICGMTERSVCWVPDSVLTSLKQ